MKPTIVKFASVAPDDSNIEVLASQLQQSKADADRQYEDQLKQLEETQDQLQMEARTNAEFQRRVDQLSNEALMAEQEYQMKLKSLGDKYQTQIDAN